MIIAPLVWSMRRRVLSRRGVRGRWRYSRRVAEVDEDSAHGAEGFCRKLPGESTLTYDRGRFGTREACDDRVQRQSLRARGDPVGCSLVCGLPDQLSTAGRDDGRAWSRG